MRPPWRFLTDVLYGGPSRFIGTRLIWPQVWSLLLPPQLLPLLTFLSPLAFCPFPSVVLEHLHLTWYQELHPRREETLGVDSAVVEAGSFPTDPLGCFHFEIGSTWVGFSTMCFEDYYELPFENFLSQLYTNNCPASGRIDKRKGISKAITTFS